MEVHMRKGLLVSVATMLGLIAAGATDASACRRSGYCGETPPLAYRYGPPPAYGYLPAGAPYGYVPPAPVYSWAPPRYAPAYGYGYRGWRDCNRGYRYAPPAAYGDAAAYDDDDYQPAAVWVPGR
jgi:hypothetical protein